MRKPIFVKLQLVERPRPPLLDSLKDDRATLPLHFYLRKLPSQQRSQMLDALNLLAQWMSNGAQSAITFDWRSLRAADLPRISDLTPCFSTRQISRMKRGLNHVSREACRLSDIEEGELGEIINTSWMRIIPRTGRTGLSSAENFEAVLTACARDKSARGARDAAMITILWETKVKSCDLVTVTLSDLQLGHIVLRGRGRRLSSAAQWRLSEWQRYRGELPGPLFVSITRTGVIQMRAITASTIAWTLRRRVTA
jgi:integrase